MTNKEYEDRIELLEFFEDLQSVCNKHGGFVRSNHEFGLTIGFEDSENKLQISSEVKWSELQDEGTEAKWEIIEE